MEVKRTTRRYLGVLNLFWGWRWGRREEEGELEQGTA